MVDHRKAGSQPIKINLETYGKDATKEEKDFIKQELIKIFKATLDHMKINK